MNNDIIVTSALTKYYGHRRGIEDLSLTISRGQIFGFLGPNGSGKTTTIRALLGLIRPTRGTAHVFGLDCWRDSPAIKQDTGYLPGDLRLWPWMNCHSGLRIIGRMRGRDLMDDGMALAERFGLEPGVPVRNMSRGMRQKLGLILVLAHEPKLLVLDEPSSALDPQMQDQLYAYLRERAHDGATVFFSSHTLSEVEQLCDDVAILRTGHLIARESLTSLTARAERLVTLQWKAAATPSQDGLPEQLCITAQDGETWQGTLRGPSIDLVRWASEQPLEDLSITPPDLETLFRRYYEDEDAAP